MHRPLVRLSYVSMCLSLYMLLEVVLKKDGVSKKKMKFSTHIKNIVENKRRNILQKDVVVFLPEYHTI